MVQVVKGAYLAGGMALATERKILAGDARTIIQHADQVDAAVLQGKGDRRRLGVDRVVDKLPYDACGPVDDLARGDASRHQWIQPCDMCQLEPLVEIQLAEGVADERTGR